MQNKLVVPIDVNTGEVQEISNDIKTKVRSQTQEKKRDLFASLVFGEQKVEDTTPDEDYNAKCVTLVYLFATGTLKDVEYLILILKTYGNHLVSVHRYKLLALLFISLNKKQSVKKIFKESFNDLVRTEEELCDFTTMIKSKTFRGYGKLIQNATVDRIKTFPVEQFLFAAQRVRARDFNASLSSLRTDGFTLSDVIKLSHIKPETSVQQALFKALITGDISSKDVPNEYIRFLEYTRSQDLHRIKILNDVEFPVDLIMANNPGKNVSKWACLHSDIAQMLCYFGMYNTHDLFKYDNECITYACNLFNDKQKVKDANFPPLVYFQKADSYMFLKNNITASLYAAGEEAYVNTFPIRQKTIMFADQSSGMEELHSVQIARSYKYLVNMLCATIYKQADDPQIIPYTRKVESLTIDKSMSTAAITDLLTQGYRSSFVSHNSTFKWLVDNMPQAENIIFFTHNRPWDDILLNTDAGDLLSSYLSRLLYKPKLLFVNMKNGHVPTTNTLENSFFIPRFSVSQTYLQIMKHISDYS